MYKDTCVDKRKRKENECWRWMVEEEKKKEEVVEEVVVEVVEEMEILFRLMRMMKERKKERRRKSLGRRGFKYPRLSQNCASGVTGGTMTASCYCMSDTSNTLIENEDARHHKQTTPSIAERGMKV